MSEVVVDAGDEGQGVQAIHLLKAVKGPDATSLHGLEEYSLPVKNVKNVKCVEEHNELVYMRHIVSCSLTALN